MVRGVWCLFEFLLSKQLELELVFATDVGVIGDDGCTSFDIALELGKKIESLQVANCYASSDGDRTDKRCMTPKHHSQQKKRTPGRCLSLSQFSPLSRSSPEDDLRVFLQQDSHLRFHRFVVGQPREHGRPNQRPHGADAGEKPRECGLCHKQPFTKVGPKCQVCKRF